MTAAGPDPLVRALADRQDLRDLVARYCRGVDRRDMDLVRSCYHHDAVDRRGSFVGGVEDFVARLGRLERYAGTLHVIGNHLAELDGDLAYGETYVVAHHWGDPPDDPGVNYAIGARYVDRFERRGRAWRIAERQAVREWVRPATGAGAYLRPEPEGPQARRDRTDPVYR